jgi:hypothetical protein
MSRARVFGSAAAVKQPFVDVGQRQQTHRAPFAPFRVLPMVAAFAASCKRRGCAHVSSNINSESALQHRKTELGIGL